jgi:antitoxin component of RelBE/YafQ-DinJ toxin-antitoxin module
MQRVQILLTEDIKMQVMSFAHSQNISFSEAVRMLLSDGLNTAVQPVRKSNQLLAFRDLVEQVKKLPVPKNVPKDLSTNDDYLYKI